MSEGVKKTLEIIGIVMLLASLIEALMLRFVLKQSYDWRSAGASFVLFLGRPIFDLVPLAVAMPGAQWLYEHRSFAPETLGGWSYLLLFAVLEFQYYWWHRVSHRCRWFWTNHAVHHSPNRFNLSAAYRLGWHAKLTAGYIVFAPLAWLGYSPGLIFLAYSLNLAYQFWIHAEWIPKLGPLEGIFNTPSAHRVHHASNAEYLDANYGGVLLVFDRLFGTYRAERSDLQLVYGLVEPTATNNPLKLAFLEFGPLFRDLRRARGVWQTFICLFGPPSRIASSPQGSRDTQDALVPAPCVQAEASRM